MGQIYSADDIIAPAITIPDGSTITRPFKLTAATALLTTGAAGFLIGDVLLLAPVPGGATLVDYLINIPELDTGSAVTYDVGDTQILSGAVSGFVGTTNAFTTKALGQSQTITASASTASFTSTNAVIAINGVLFGYASLSGSTFVTAYSNAASTVIPGGALIQQCGNLAAYGAAVVPSGSGSAVSITSFVSISGTALTTSTLTPSALPTAPFPYTYGTPGNTTVPANIGQNYFTLKIHASPTTYNAPSVPITGYIKYQMRGASY